MNGAEAIVRTLLAGGVEACFANPGTFEMNFVVGARTYCTAQSSCTGTVKFSPSRPPST